MNVRAYLPAVDEPQILEIVSAQVTVAFHWPAELLRSELVIAQCQVLEDQGRVLAFACLRDMVDAWEISVLGTHPLEQNRGFMTCLLGAILKTYGSQRQLWLEVHESNLSACKLYENLGFKLQGTRGGYYRDGSAAKLYSYFP